MSLLRVFFFFFEFFVIVVVSTQAPAVEFSSLDEPVKKEKKEKKEVKRKKKKKKGKTVTSDLGQCIEILYWYYSEKGEKRGQEREKEREKDLVLLRSKAQDSGLLLVSKHRVGSWRIFDCSFGQVQ
jgi:hypothetical protein